MRVLLISGSLRERSTNTAVLRTAVPAPAPDAEPTPAAPQPDKMALNS